MGKISLFIAEVVAKVRDALSKAFDKIDSLFKEAEDFVSEYGDTILEFTYTTAVKIERYIPSSGFGNDKAAMFDYFLANVLIPQLSALRGTDLNAAIKAKVKAAAKDKLEDFVKERNLVGDWDQYIEELNKTEADLGIAQ